LRSRILRSYRAGISLESDVGKGSDTVSRAWIVFILASANFFLSQFYRSTNAVIATQLVRDLSLDTEDLGLLSAAFFHAFGLAQIPITVFLDRIGARRMITGFSLAEILGAFVRYGIFAAFHTAFLLCAAFMASVAVVYIFTHDARSQVR
jgi:sugar phosphate permease